MSIQTEYRGYKISFWEDDEAWSCEDLSITKAAKLSAVKRRIDDLLKKERKIGVKALMFSREYGRRERAQIKTVEVTVLCEPESSFGNATLKVRKAWIRTEGGRAKVSINDLVPLENRADVEAWCRLDDAVQQATAAAEACLKAVPRHDADSLLLASKEAAAA